MHAILTDTHTQTKPYLYLKPSHSVWHDMDTLSGWVASHRHDNTIASHPSGIQYSCYTTHHTHK